MKSAVCFTLALATIIGSFSPSYAVSASFDNTEFPLKLYKQLAKDRKDKNILVSPFSISSALGMTLNGAKGKTKADMAKVLGYDTVNLQQMNQNAKTAFTSLRMLRQGTKLEIANGLFAKSGTIFNKNFLALNKLNYSAGIQALDFSSPSAVNTINRWVGSKTQNKIPNIIKRTSSNDVLFLVNAVYFKGAWQYEFNKSRTFGTDFHLNNKTKKRVQMMYMTNDDFKYYETAGFQAVRLNYKDRRLSLVLVLPKSNESLSLFESELSHDIWTDILSGFRKRKGQLGLPRFKIEDQINLKEQLSALGMADAFVCGKADFSGMTASKEQLYISRALHKTFMEVNEEGTEAAAVTAFSGTAKGLFHPPRVPVFKMILNRPFLFAVHDIQTDTILFMGHVANPSSK